VRRRRSPSAAPAAAPVRTLASALALALGLAASSATELPAATLHVDAGSGDDADDGATWASAVASLERAVELASGVPVGSRVTIRVADGTYGVADLEIDRPVVLVGAFAPGGGSRDRGAFASVLEAGGAESVLVISPAAEGSVLDGFTLRGASGVALDARAPLTARNLALVDNTGLGARLVGGSSIESSLVARCARGGLDLVAGACNERLIARHLLIEDCGRLGLRTSDRGCGFGAVPAILVEHVRVVRTTGTGMSLGCCPEVSDVAVVDTTGPGVVLSSPAWEPPPLEPPGAALRNVTITGSTGAAVRLGNAAQATMRRSILWGNAGGDLDPPAAPTSASFTLSESLLPGPGNLAGVDPLLVTGPSGDTYLAQVASGQAADSPAVDAGDVPASGLSVGLRTTRTDGVRDAGSVDLGFHHEPVSYTLSRGTEPDALVPLLTGITLPVRDADAGTADRLFYRVDADRTILVGRDALDVVVRFERQRFDTP